MYNKNIHYKNEKHEYTENISFNSLTNLLN